jgi:hypothetical protein
MSKEEFEQIDNSYAGDFALWRALGGINSFIEISPKLTPDDFILSKDIVNELLTKLTDIKTQILNVEHEATISRKP